MTFRDHFSNLSGTYAQYRPHYPEALFTYLASLTPSHRLAWDCGTGNGQAAHGLAQTFERVYATDASQEQISLAQPHERIEYHLVPAEGVSLSDASVDLVTVAIAVHWFEFDQFYREVERVLKPGGVLAVWGYSFPAVEPEIDRVIRKYHDQVLAGYWPERYNYVAQDYSNLPFPLAEIVPPKIVMEANWSLDQFGGFLSSWSASQRYLEKNGKHPLEEVWDILSALWGGSSRKRQIKWRIYMRVGRKSKISKTRAKRVEL
jgi:ubiquinone/menaquinone biosynthesis C-methylase UbiE